MKKTILTGLASVAAAVISFSSIAFADHYSLDLHDSYGLSPNKNAGKLTDFELEYNLHDNTLGFYMRVEEYDYKDTSGFWMVLNNGGNPKDKPDELAILYGDLYTDTLTAYVYNGANSANSWDGGQFIGSYALDGSYYDGPGNTGEYTASFNISLDEINDPTGKPSPWKGIHFEDTVGIWFHNFKHQQGAITYDNDGRITAFHTKYTAWFDTNGTPTEFVPWTTTSEPAPFGLFLLAGLAVFAMRRKSSSARLATA